MSLSRRVMTHGQRPMTLTTTEWGWLGPTRVAER